MSWFRGFFSSEPEYDDLAEESSCDGIDPDLLPDDASSVTFGRDNDEVPDHQEFPDDFDDDLYSDGDDDDIDTPSTSTHPIRSSPLRYTNGHIARGQPAEEIARLRSAPGSLTPRSPGIIKGSSVIFPRSGSLPPSSGGPFDIPPRSGSLAPRSPGSFKGNSGSGGGLFGVPPPKSPGGLFGRPSTTPPFPRSPLGAETNFPSTSTKKTFSSSTGRKPFQPWKIQKVDPLRYQNRLDQPRRLPNTPTKSHLPPSPRRKGPKAKACPTCNRAFRVVKEKKGKATPTSTAKSSAKTSVKATTKAKVTPATSTLRKSPRASKKPARYT